MKSIFTPGPTEVPSSVLDALIKHKAHHRSAEFKRLHKNLIENLRKIFLTEQNLLVLTCSGTGAMESAVLNFCSPGDNVFFVNQGRFGSRWGAICRTYNYGPHEIKVEPGYAVQKQDFDRIEIKKADVIFLTHSETSTATLTDIRMIIKHIKSFSEALIVVDGITSIGALEFRMDDWDIDVAVAASQKALMCPPGISVIAFSERAKNKMFDNPAQRYYFDLRKEFKEAENYNTVWTPSIGLFYALDEASRIILNEGLEQCWKRVSMMADYFRRRCIEIGFGIFSKFPTDSLTAVEMSGNIPSSLLIKRLKEKHDIFVANGQDELQDRIFRVSHMGNLAMEDFEMLCSILENEYRDIINTLE